MKQSKKLLKFIICILFVSAVVPSVAQKYNVKGRVIDSETKKPLDSVSVILYGVYENDFLVYITDESGIFYFKYEACCIVS